MSPTLLTVLAVIAGVALLGFGLRRSSNPEEPGVAPAGRMPRAAGPADDDLGDDDLEDDDDDGSPALIVEMSGSVWVVARDGVRRVSLGGEETDPALAAAGYVNRDAFESRLAEARARGDSSAIAGERLRPGDFTAARVMRGAPDTDPWRLEALGPEGEYIAFAFGAESSARAAREALERHGIVRRPLDEDGAPIPASAEDFEEARRRVERTLEELAASGDEPFDPLP